MRVLGDFLRIGSLFGLALVLARCSGASTTEEGGEAGDAGETGQGASGGSVSGSGGKSGGRGGAAGTGGNAGSGTAGIGGSAGNAGSAGSPVAGRGGNAGAGGTLPGKTGGHGGDAGATDGGSAGVPGAAGIAGKPGSGGEGGDASGEAGAGVIGAGGADAGQGGEAPGGTGAGGAPEQPLDGDACSTAIPLEGTASGSTGAFTNDQTNASCLTWPLAGPDVAYSVSIPPLSRFQVVADPSDTFDIAMYLVSPPEENCSAVPVCTISADLHIEGRDETLVLDNFGDTWQSYFLMIDGYGAATSAGEYTLTASTNPIPAGEACGNATPLAVGAPVTGTLDGFANDYTGQPVCLSANARGADVVYSVTVPAGNTLTVLADPTAAMDIALYAFDALTPAQCATASACLASADVGFGGGNETLSYTNGGSAARTLFLHVDRFDQGSVEGGYTLTATLTPAI